MYSAQKRAYFCHEMSFLGTEKMKGTSMGTGKNMIEETYDRRL